MSRARGKHQPHRVPDTVETDNPEDRYIGASGRTQGVPSDIPGGRPHIGNHESVRHPVPAPEARKEYRGIMAHGVPPGSATTGERAEMMRGPNDLKILDPQHLTSDPERGPDPVPVYLVERGGGRKVLRSSSPRHITLQASTGEPVRVCGQNFRRVRISLLNESTSSDIRFAQRPSDLVNGGGALLPWPANTYTRMDTQDELYAISADSGTPLLSIVEEFEQSW